MYLSWIEHLKLLFLDSPASMLQEIKDTDKFINEWIEKESSWSTPRTKEEAKNVFKVNVKPLFTLLDMLEKRDCDDWLIIPDTNAILTCPEIERYSEVISTKDYSVIFTPTVLAELDDLKVKSRDNDFREKVKSVINRIKGWRNQGSLLNGVTVHKTVKVRMLAKEPDFSNNLKWLESSNSDDRIIASVLEIQREFPSSIICLITSDINLQNKAEMANIPFVEPPESRV